jgi:hypothetical protein
MSKALTASSSSLRASLIVSSPAMNEGYLAAADLSVWIRSESAIPPAGVGTFLTCGRWSTLKKHISFGMVVLALTIGTGTPALANPGQVPAPPPATDDFSPGRACAHANLAANRNFGSNHLTGVVGNGTPPTCAGGGGGGG